MQISQQYLILILNENDLLKTCERTFHLHGGAIGYLYFFARPQQASRTVAKDGKRREERRKGMGTY